MLDTTIDCRTYPPAGAGGLRLVPVSGRPALIRFLTLTRRLYADDPCWIEPLLVERLRHLDPRHNPYFRHAEVAYWLAERDGEPVGRISAQRDRRPGAAAGIGHFGFLDAVDDGAVFAALLAAAEDWLRARGAVRVLGPFTLSINDESGLLVDGFATPPFVLMGHAPPYAAGHLLAAGYAAEKTLLAFRYPLDRPLPASAQHFLAKVSTAAQLRFRPLSWRDYSGEIARIVAIFNDAWAGNWGFVPFDEAELAHLARSLKPLIRAEDVAIGEVDGEPAAMAVALPNLNEAIADLHGRLTPLGLAKLFWRVKVRGLKSARVPLLGVVRRHQGSAIGTALMLGVIDRLRRAHQRRGTKVAELSWVLADNRPMRRLIEAIGGEPYKTYRLFGKTLA